MHIREKGFYEFDASLKQARSAGVNAHFYESIKCKTTISEFTPTEIQKQATSRGLTLLASLQSKFDLVPLERDVMWKTSQSK